MTSNIDETLDAQALQDSPSLRQTISYADLLNEPGNPILIDARGLLQPPAGRPPAFSYANTVGTDTEAWQSDEFSQSSGEHSFGSGLSTPADTVRTPSAHRSLGTRVFGEGELKESIDPARFQILKVLGEGAAGRVYLAFDRDIGREVAIKFYRSDSDKVSNDIAREVRISGRIVHPGMTPLYDVGRGNDGSYYSVMKHLVGCTLDELISRLRSGDEDLLERYSFHLRANMIVQLLRVLVATHRLGIVHRDIKPENIVIGPTGDLSLIDWSIALDLSEGDGSGTVSGTPSHMAPEQAMGAATDVRADVYGVAATFYELLSLEVPAPTDCADLLSMIQAIPTYVPPRVDSMHHPAQGYAPSEYANLIERGLSRAPADRHPTALAMLHALEQIQTGRISASCSRTSIKSRLHHLMRWLDRDPYRNVPLLWAGIGATVLTLVGFGVLLATIF